MEYVEPSVKLKKLTDDTLFADRGLDFSKQAKEIADAWDEIILDMLLKGVNR